MKRFICVLAALFLLAMLPVTALAGDAGTCGEGITWEYSDGVLTISGSGKMADFAEGTAPWETYKEQITTVKFTGGVSHVGAYSFKNYDKITSVSFGESMVSLGQSAFENCDGLTALTMPYTGKMILGQDSMRNCKNLKRIDFAGRFPKFETNCLWDTYCTLYYSAANPWPADTIKTLEDAFKGRIEFRGSDGSDPVKPTEAPKPTEPAPTEKPKPKPTTGNTPTPTETVTIPTWSVPTETITTPTFTLPTYISQAEEEEQEEGGFSGWIAVVVVIGLLAGFAAVTIHVQEAQRRKRRKQRRPRPDFQ